MFKIWETQQYEKETEGKYHIQRLERICEAIGMISEEQIQKAEKRICSLLKIDENNQDSRNIVKKKIKALAWEWMKMKI